VSLCVLEPFKNNQLYQRTYPFIFTIAGAKRDDMNNFDVCQSFFEDLNFDSVTVAPYGKD
jgi:hypothetical protein